MSLQTTIDRIADRTIVRVRGDVDLATAPELCQALEPLGPTEQVTVDLSEVAFIDSSGLRVLLEFASDSRDGNAPLRIASPSRTVLRVMEIVGMTELPQIEVQADEGQHG
jgi:anti-anti-sigma factor